jgi:hypothetical protein
MERLIALALIVYLLVVGLGATTCLVASFPTEPVTNASTAKCTVGSLIVVDASGERIIMIVAFLAGVVGSFLHAAQSLATYVGNDDFKMSWASWYVLRPWIGGILGFALYFMARAGLVGASGGSGVDPYGVVAVGLLGGWFSKTTTDKLQEVFSTLFKTDADKARKDKLTSDEQPVVTLVSPSPITGAATQLTLTGSGFANGAVARIGDTSLETTFVSPKSLTVSLAKLGTRPTGDVTIVVKNPAGAKPEAVPFKITFAP